MNTEQVGKVSWMKTATKIAQMALIGSGGLLLLLGLIIWTGEGD